MNTKSITTPIVPTNLEQRKGNFLLTKNAMEAKPQTEKQEVVNKKGATIHGYRTLPALAAPAFRPPKTPREEGVAIVYWTVLSYNSKKQTPTRHAAVMGRYRFHFRCHSVQTLVSSRLVSSCHVFPSSSIVLVRRAQSTGSGLGLVARLRCLRGRLRVLLSELRPERRHLVLEPRHSLFVLFAHARHALLHVADVLPDIDLGIAKDLAHAAATAATVARHASRLRTDAGSWHLRVLRHWSLAAERALLGEQALWWREMWRAVVGRR